MSELLLACLVFSSVSITLLALWDFKKAKKSNQRRMILIMDLVAAAASLVALVAVIVVWSS